MEIQTVSMDPRIAAIYYKDYRKKVREHRRRRLAEATELVKTAQRIKSDIENEDAILMVSYREMAKGQRLVNVAGAMTQAGFDLKEKLPKLAIAAANWSVCHLSHGYGQLVFSSNASPSSRWNKNTRRHAYVAPAISFPESHFAAEITNARWRQEQQLPRLERSGIKTIVPTVPAHLRPEGDLSRYTILWEARWQVHQAPPDPLLLRHVAGFMYSVCAQWDLTQIEKAILEGRA